jgi:hypothetical protein
MSEDREIKFEHGGEIHTLAFRESDHAYLLNGKRTVSVSTLAKVEYSDPGGLMRWAVKEEREGRDFTASRDFAAACGQAAHAQLDTLAKTGEPLDMEGQEERTRGAIRAVSKWWLQHKPNFISSEVIVCSVTNLYAGRFDFLAEVDGELVLADLKTTDFGRDWDHFRKHKAKSAYAQLAGYQIAYREMYGDKPQPTGRYILRVGAEGTFDWKRDLVPEMSERSFLSKLETYRADQEYGRAYSKALKQAA